MNDLNEASDIKIVLAYLCEIGVTTREIAQSTGADERSVRRWIDPNNISRIQPRYSKRIDDLRSLVMLLSDTLPGEQTARWLRARNRILKRERPLEVLARDEYQRVEEAAEQFVNGDPI